jgi:hypothetical protein
MFRGDIPTDYYPIDTAEALDTLGSEWKITPQHLVAKSNIPRILKEALASFDSALQGAGLLRQYAESGKIGSDGRAIEDWLIFKKFILSFGLGEPVNVLQSAKRGISNLLNPATMIQEDDISITKNLVTALKEKFYLNELE